MNPFQPQRIAILGPGLLGGSLLMAIRQHLPSAHLSVWARSESAVNKVKALQLAEVASTSLQEVVHQADFIVLCVPVERMATLAREILGAEPARDCVITDVGSIKTGVVGPLEDLFIKSPFHFLGSHPMAGSERAGIESARADLFQGAACILTPTLFTDEIALHHVRAFWLLMGCRILEMSPEDHDRKVARISHLPHVVAAAVTLAALHEEPDAVLCVGNGFRDSTRVAAGDADLWTGILLGNRTEVMASLQDTQERLRELLAILENVDEKALRHYLGEAKLLRDSIPASA
ncbi:prephenate dehydrogenase/arogenate dehydrogenase family protein [soil metagenome]